MPKLQVAKVGGYPTVAFFKNGRSIEYKPPKDGGALSALHIANTAFRKAKAFLKGACQPYTHMDMQVVEIAA
eukprot:COSAG02_NODE_4237_length_5599_cov_6.352000_3_plen_72_part_00